MRHTYYTKKRSDGSFNTVKSQKKSSLRDGSWDKSHQAGSGMAITTFKMEVPKIVPKQAKNTRNKDLTKS